MKTRVVVHRLQSEASLAYSKEARENIQKDRFRMYPTYFSYDCEGIKTMHVSMEEWDKAIIPRGEDVSVELECMLTEEERLMISREWIIR